MALRRIRKELDQIHHDNDDNDGMMAGKIQVVQLTEDDLLLQATVEGPEDSPYSDGRFIISIQIPHKYPFEAPTMRFVTNIWHPNISYENGRIGLNFLEDHGWNPAWTIQKMLVVIFSVMSDPIVRDKGELMNAEAAEEYQENRQQFVANARFLTTVHTANHPTEDTRAGMLRRLEQMGFPVDLARLALDRSHWNEDAAVVDLLDIVEGENRNEVVGINTPDTGIEGTETASIGILSVDDATRRSEVESRIVELHMHIDIPDDQSETQQIGCANDIEEGAGEILAGSTQGDGTETTSYDASWVI